MNGNHTKSDFKGVTVHEVGHALGLGHSGRYDGFDSDESTMSGCWISKSSVMKSYEQDDTGSFAATYHDADLHSNASFEDTGGWTRDIWGVGGGATLVNRTASSSPRGTHHGEIQNGGYIFQTMQVTDPGNMRAGMYAKKELSVATGSVILFLQAREVEYDTVTSGSCLGKWINDWNLDRNPDRHPNGTSFITYKSRFISPTTSWPGSAWETNSWTTVNDWDGVDVRVRVENNIEFDGGPMDVDVDHVRVRHDP